jgi:hypothetical protein
MGRQMVVQRKGAPNPGVSDERIADRVGEADSDPSGQGAGQDGTSDNPDVAECPNCGCQFDETSGDVVKEGAKVVGHPDAQGPVAQGIDLDTSDSAPPVPGKYGSAHDGSQGTEAMAALLGRLGGGAR